MATNAIAGVELGDPDLAATTSAGLDRVEELLHREVTSGYHFVTETSLHLIDAGGKRFRPLFTLLGAQMGPRPDADEVITAAAVVELIHLATLYHDDVMDDATMRRGAPSANSRWDNTRRDPDRRLPVRPRLPAGGRPRAGGRADHRRDVRGAGHRPDARDPRPAAGRRPRRALPHGDRGEDRFADRDVRRATAACSPAARRSQIESLHRFGAAIGTAFQISDDIIDITSPSASSGKTPGTDLREGVLTLPMLYALQDTAPAADRLRVLLARPITDDAEVDEALALLRAGPGVARAARGARRARLGGPQGARPAPRLLRGQGPGVLDHVRGGAHGLEALETPRPPALPTPPARPPSRHPCRPRVGTFAVASRHTLPSRVRRLR